MKRNFTYSIVTAIAILFLTACSKERFLNTNESYWLSQERGVVIYSDIYCNYYVVETYNGYTVVRTYGGYRPFEGSVVYGNFSYYGAKDFYNRTSGVIFTGTVTDYWLSYNGALDALDYYCPVYGNTTSKSGFREGRKADTK